MTPGPWTVEADTKGGRVVYSILAEDGNTVVATIDGYRGCVEGKLRRLSPEENAANADFLTALLRDSHVWDGQ